MARSRIEAAWFEAADTLFLSCSQRVARMLARKRCALKDEAITLRKRR
jgi:hypothetical protein